MVNAGLETGALLEIGVPLLLPITGPKTGFLENGPMSMATSTDCHIFPILL